MKNTEFETNIQEWLEDVATTCDKFAKEIDLDFYCFQSPVPSKPVDLLIVAINPGGDKSYIKALDEKSKDAGKQITSRSADMLAFGENTYATKPQWEIDYKLKGNDVMRIKLKRVFITDYLQKALNESTVINLYYFNTKNTDKLGTLSNDIKKYCVKKTNEFISIVNPKLILFFTTCESDLINVGVKNIKSIGSCMKEGYLNQKRIIAVPNPGYYKAYSYENGGKMGCIIEEYLKTK